MAYENEAQTGQTSGNGEYDYASAILNPSRVRPKLNKQPLIGDAVSGFDVYFENAFDQYLAGLRAIASNGAHPVAVQTLVENHSLLFEKDDLTAILTASDEELEPEILKIKEHLGIPFSQTIPEDNQF